MKNIILFSVFLILILFKINSVNAVDVQVFDSTDNYLGTCQLTDKSEWELKEDINVTKFQVWYRWDQGETKLPVKVFQNGEKFAEFEATRTACDPYQRQWCNADFVINKLFTKGKYSTEIPNSRQCLKPGGTGAIRLYKEDSSVKKEEPSPTPTITPKVEKNVQSTVIAAPKSTPCSCSQTTILMTAAVTSLATSLIVTLLLRR